METNLVTQIRYEHQRYKSPRASCWNDASFLPMPIKGVTQYHGVLRVFTLYYSKYLTNIYKIKELFALLFPVFVE